MLPVTNWYWALELDIGNTGNILSGFGRQCCNTRGLALKCEASSGMEAFRDHISCERRRERLRMRARADFFRAFTQGFSK